MYKILWRLEMVFGLCLRWWRVTSVCCEKDICSLTKGAAKMKVCVCVFKESLCVSVQGFLCEGLCRRCFFCVSVFAQYEQKISHGTKEEKLA